MPTIGLDKVYYAKITEDTNGNESYGIPIHLARATEAEISLGTYDAEHYSDCLLYTSPSPRDTT